MVAERIYVSAHMTCILHETRIRRTIPIHFLNPVKPHVHHKLTLAGGPTKLCVGAQEAASVSLPAFPQCMSSHAPGVLFTTAAGHLLLVAKGILAAGLDRIGPLFNGNQ